MKTDDERAIKRLLSILVKNRLIDEEAERFVREAFLEPEPPSPESAFEKWWASLPIHENDPTTRYVFPGVWLFKGQGKRLWERCPDTIKSTSL